ncbi:MAG: hypothetical protein J5762_05710 [Clostridia bacterium]|nr:hypothetical protein [Clostridia bacterium]
MKNEVASLMKSLLTELIVYVYSATLLHQSVMLVFIKHEVLSSLVGFADVFI